MKLIVALFVASISLCLLPSLAQAQSEDNLKGVTDALVITVVDKQMKDAGVSENDIQTSVELKLRSAGMKVLTVSDPALFTKNLNRIILGVEIHGMKIDKMPAYCYMITYTVTGAAQQVKTPNQVFYPVIWHTETFGYVGEDKLAFIKETNDALCDKLANDYLKANPKSSPVTP